MEIQSSNYAIQNPQIGLPSGQELTYQTPVNQPVINSVLNEWFGLTWLVIILLLIGIYRWLRR